MNTAPIEALFARVTKFIDEGRELLRADLVPELNDLDQHVKSLCETMIRLSQEERLAYVDRLQHMLVELKAMGETMMQKRDALAIEINDVSKHKKASIAYAITDAAAAVADEEKK